jgi:hypothetical protein
MIKITFLLPKYLVNALLRIANRLHALPFRGVDSFLNPGGLAVV